MPGRQFVGATGYRYGFNGKESDDEIKGSDNSYDFGERIYDSRLGKFLSTDPLTKRFGFFSPYQFAGNTPIVAIDLDGLEDVWIHTKPVGDGSYMTVFTASLNEAARDYVWYRLTGDPTGGVPDEIIYTFTNAGGQIETIYPDVPLATTVSNEKEYSFFEEADRGMISLMGDSYGEGEGFGDAANMGTVTKDDYIAAGKLALGMVGGPLGFILAISSASETGVSQSVGDNTGNSSIMSVTINAGTGNELNSNVGKVTATVIDLTAGGADAYDLIKNIEKNSLETTIIQGSSTLIQQGDATLSCGEDLANPQ